LVDNSFGGTALYSDEFNSENNWINGWFYQPAPDPKLTQTLGTPEVLANSSFGGAVYPTTSQACTDAAAGYAAITGGGLRNTLGITPILMYQLMSEHVLLDIAHMGELSASLTLQIAQKFKYPVMDSHTGIRNDSANYTPQNDVPNGRPGLTFQINERSLPISQAIIIGNLGGVIGLGSSGTTNWPDPVGQWVTAYKQAQQLIAEGNGGVMRGVAFGTDMNGLSPQIAFDTTATIYPITVAASTSPPSGVSTPALPPFGRMGWQSNKYNFENDGIANYGMLPDFIQAMSTRPGSRQVVQGLYNSAEDVIEMWEAVEKTTVVVPAVTSNSCPLGQVYAKCAAGNICIPFGNTCPNSNACPIGQVMSICGNPGRKMCIDKNTPCPPDKGNGNKQPD
jgi:hypothetical protein